MNKRSAADRSSSGWLRALKDGVDVDVVVVPRSSKTKIVGLHDQRLKVQLTAPPVDGEANTALIALFSELLGVRKQQITLVAGQTGRRKTLRITGVAENAVRALSPTPDPA